MLILVEIYPPCWFWGEIYTPCWFWGEIYPHWWFWGEKYLLVDSGGKYTPLVGSWGNIPLLVGSGGIIPPRLVGSGWTYITTYPLNCSSFHQLAMTINLNLNLILKQISYLIAGRREIWIIKLPKIIFISLSFISCRF